ncbi:MAG: PqqD family protein [Syntrophotaleaceae bacterium]
MDKEIVVLKLGTGEYFTFNDLGREIWLYLTEGCSIYEIIQKIVEDYEVNKEQATTDVKIFTEGLLHNGLLTTLKSKEDV